MTYTKFYSLLSKYFTNSEIAKIQEIAFKEYKDAHGYRPMRKNQKQCAYGFLIDFIYSEIVNCLDCYEYLKYTGVSFDSVKEFWKSLDY